MDTRHRNPAGGLVVHCADEDRCTVFSWEICLQEIPGDAVRLTDAQDYVHHFCGLECLAIWQERAGAQPAETRPDRLK